LERAIARESAHGFGITYIHGDAASPSVLIGEVFDAIVCSFGLSDLDDLEGAIATVARLLNPHVIFSMFHPCFGGGQDVSGSWPAWRTNYDEGW
jgi:ubiquinone/menaquinone biosynthesis C-methylase UbiE